MMPDEEMKKAFGKMLKERRNAMNMTQAVVAELTGIERSSYAHYERGSRDIPFTNIYKLESVLRFRVSDFYKSIGR